MELLDKQTGLDVYARLSNPKHVSGSPTIGAVFKAKEATVLAGSSDPTPAQFTRQEVRNNSDPGHVCWIIVEGQVYDITDFFYEHPGGSEILLEHAGSDATSAFQDVGHSQTASEMMRKYWIGVLKEGE